VLLRGDESPVALAAVGRVAYCYIARLLRKIGEPWANHDRDQKPDAARDA